jgi:hypothetical protein
MPAQQDDGPSQPTAAARITGAGEATKTLVEFGEDFDRSRIETRGEGVEASVAGGALRVRFNESRWSAVAVKAPAGGWDASDHVAVDIDVRNVGDRRVALRGQLNWNKCIDGFVVLEPGRAGVLRIFIKRKRASALHEKHFEAMRGLPGGFVWHWVEVNPAKIGRVSVAAIDDSGGGVVEIRSVTAVGSYGLPPEKELGATFFPFVDVYGQYMHADWPRKTKSDADLAAQRAEEERDLGAHPGPGGWNRYGGWAAGPKLEATGHFRTQKHEGKWWLVDPEGRLFWSHGIDCVRLGTDTRVKGRERYFTKPEGGFGWNKHDFGAANQRRRYGDGWEARATELAHARLRSWGMNTVANWSQDKVYLARKTPYVVAIHYGCPQIGSKFPDVRRPEFRKALRKTLEMQRGKTADDPWCIGYFIDNELRWPRKGRAKLADTYYRACRDEMKAVAPNKLYLGSRLHGHDKPHGGDEDTVRAAAKYCDVIGVNRYRFSPSDIRMPEGVDVPLVIGEFHWGALDRGMLHTGLRSVVDQAQRGATYVHYVTQALRHPNIVGTHWFQYRDQVVTGRGDGENYQIGFIDICDTPYAETIEAARSIGRRMYEVRMGRSVR